MAAIRVASLAPIAAVAVAVVAACKIPDKYPGELPIDGASDSSSGSGLDFAMATYSISPAVVNLDGATGTATLVLQNSNAMAANALAFSITPSTTQLTLTDNCGPSLAGNASCNVTATLDPSVIGSHQFNVTAMSALGGDSAMVTGMAGARVQVTINNIATGAATTQGRVRSTPTGIDCGMGMAQCDATFTTGTSVTLTATDDVGTVIGWGSGGCSINAPCVLQLSNDHNLTTSFRAPLSYVDGGGADQAEGVAFDPTDGSIVVAGSRGNDGILMRLDGSTGTAGAPVLLPGATVRHILDVGVASNRTVAIAGEWTGTGGYDAVKSELSSDFTGETALAPIGDTPNEQATGVCVDGANRVHAAGTTGAGTNMFWGRWPAGSASPDWLPNSAAAAKAGSAFDIACGNNAIWVVGQSPANGNGWLGRIDEGSNGGAVNAEVVPGGMTHAYGVAVYGTGVVVSGHNGSQTIVRRYTAALTEVWSQPFMVAEVVSGSAIATDPTAGAAIYLATSGTACTLRKLDGATGTVLWTKTVVADGSCFDVAANSSGVAVAGFANIGGTRQLFAKKYFH